MTLPACSDGPNCEIFLEHRRVGAFAEREVACAAYTEAIRHMKIPEPLDYNIVVTPSQFIVTWPTKQDALLLQADYFAKVWLDKNSLEVNNVFGGS